MAIKRIQALPVTVRENILSFNIYIPHVYKYTEDSAIRSPRAIKVRETYLLHPGAIYSIRRADYIEFQQDSNERIPVLLTRLITRPRVSLTTRRGIRNILPDEVLRPLVEKVAFTGDIPYPIGILPNIKDVVITVPSTPEDCIDLLDFGLGVEIRTYARVSSSDKLFKLAKKYPRLTFECSSIDICEPLDDSDIVLINRLCNREHSRVCINCDHPFAEGVCGIIRAVNINTTADPTILRHLSAEFLYIEGELPLETISAAIATSKRLCFNIPGTEYKKPFVEYLLQNHPSWCMDVEINFDEGSASGYIYKSSLTGTNVCSESTETILYHFPGTLLPFNIRGQILSFIEFYPTLFKYRDDPFKTVFAPLTVHVPALMYGAHAQYACARCSIVDFEDEVSEFFMKALARPRPRLSITLYESVDLGRLNANVTCCGTDNLAAFIDLYPNLKRVDLTSFNPNFGGPNMEIVREVIPILRRRNLQLDYGITIEDEPDSEIFIKNRDLIKSVYGVELKKVPPNGIVPFKRIERLTLKSRELLDLQLPRAYTTYDAEEDPLGYIDTVSAKCDVLNLRTFDIASLHKYIVTGLVTIQAYPDDLPRIREALSNIHPACVIYTSESSVRSHIRATIVSPHLTRSPLWQFASPY